MKKRITFGVLAHVDSGKTTLSEAILFNSGKTRKIGRVDTKDSYLDTNSIERDRGITIFSKQALFCIGESEFTLLDTPGHTDFGAETERVLTALDYAILLTSAPEGVQSHTRTLWKLLESYGIPTFIFVNKTDLPSMEREEIIKELKKTLSDAVTDFSPDTRDEEIALCSEEIMEEFLSGDISVSSIQKAIRNRLVFPCFFGSALKNEGVEEFMKAFDLYTSAPPKTDVFGARVFKITTDDKGQRLTHLKITGGSLDVKSILPIGDTEEKVNEIRLYSGIKYTMLTSAVQGQVCAVTGLSGTYSGMGIGFEKDFHNLMLEPVFFYRVEADEGVSDSDVLSAFMKLKSEDPKLCAEWNSSLGCVTLRLMGEVQTQVLTRIVRERFGFGVSFHEGGIVYKETINGISEGVGHYEPLRHYAEVHLILKEAPRGSGITFDSNCKTDELDENWQRLILSHLAEKTHLGVLTGSPITDIRITLAAGKAHIKHTDGGDFRQATYRAVRHGLANAQSVLLEPWYDARIEVPTECVGRVMNDLSGMGASFSSPDTMGEMSIITASAPAIKIQSYQKDITIFTRGKGSVAYELKGYEPCQNAEEIIEKIGYNFDADVENSADSIFCSHGAGVNVKWYDVYDNMHIESVLNKKTEENFEVQSKKVSFDASTVTDAELNRIFEMTFGSQKEEKEFVRNRTGAVKYKSKSSPTQLKEEYVLVDGYNIIFAWEMLKKQADEDIGLARETLINRLINYRAVRGCRLAVVFDAYKVKGGIGHIEKNGGISVVYTKEAQTADSYIEKASHTLAKHYMVRVATSDSLEQMIILGAGALRVSAEAFQKEVISVEEAIRKFIEK